MTQSVDFETPENVKLSYRIAGPGSRFVAWFIDNIFVTLFMIVIAMILVVAAIAAESTILTWMKDLLDSSIEEEGMSDREIRMRVSLILMGIYILVWGLGSFFYFYLTELLMRGQTPGKKLAKIRVVKSDGFTLDAGSIFIRNIFRLVDQIPLLWIVPLVSDNTQRFGDMVGGTLVVSSDRQSMSPLRDELLERERRDAAFRFSNTSLQRLTEEDISAIERFCERIGNVEEQRRQELLQKMVLPLSEKVGVERPAAEDYQTFLLDLLAAEYRRQEQRLG